jgi:circadian clock protein KaiC
MTAETEFDSSNELLQRVSSGNVELDGILQGGFPANSINVVMGQPGTGKTVFAEQLVFHNANGDRPILYFTTLAEPLAKVVHYAQQFNFFDETKLGTSVRYEDLGPELARDGISILLPRLKEAVRSDSPRIIVIDSFKAVNDLVASPRELRQVVYELTGLFTAYDTTVFLLGEYEPADVAKYPEFAAADGIVEFSRRELGVRDERFFRVLKLRGSQYSEGAHAFRITKAGLEVYPRLVSPAFPADYLALKERVSTGIADLDDMTQGGFWRGSSTLLAGRSGSGKTSLALQFAAAGARAGEPTLYVNFQENPTQLQRSVEWLGLKTNVPNGRSLDFLYASPVELPIDSIMVQIFRRMKEGAIQRLVIDAIGDLANSANDPQRFHNYLYALLQYLAVHRVSSMLTLETRGEDSIWDGAINSLSDNMIVLGMGGADVTRRTLRILKTRGSGHDLRVRQVEITADGVHFT